MANCSFSTWNRHDRRQVLRSFIQAAKVLLPVETYKALWAEVDRSSLKQGG
jgi:hypothetical protein